MAKRSRKSGGEADSSISTDEQDGYVKSARRVMELFSFFAEQRQPLTVSDIVRGLDYPQSSTSSLLKSLTKLGYLSYDRYSRHYLPTLRVALFGSWLHDELFSQTSLSLMTRRLAEETGESVVIGMQNEIYVQYIHLVQPPSQTNPWFVKPGSLRSLSRTGVGKILLSRKTDVDVLGLLRRINAEESDPACRTNPSDLLKELDLIRRQNFAMTEGSFTLNRGVVAVNLPTPPSQPHMAIGIGASIETLRREHMRYLKLLEQALLPYRDVRQLSAI